MGVWDDSAVHEFVSPIVDYLNETRTYWLKPVGNFSGPLEVLIGEENITSLAEPPAVVFIPRIDAAYETAEEQPDDGEADYQTWTVVEVVAWGSTGGEAECLRTGVLNALAERYQGRPAKPWPGNAAYSKGLSSGQLGVTIRFKIAFKQLLLLRALQPGTIDTVETAAPDVPDTTPGAPPPDNGLFVDTALGEDREPLPP